MIYVTSNHIPHGPKRIYSPNTPSLTMKIEDILVNIFSKPNFKQSNLFYKFSWINQYS